MRARPNVAMGHCILWFREVDLLLWIFAAIVSVGILCVDFRGLDCHDLCCTYMVPDLTPVYVSDKVLDVLNEGRTFAHNVEFDNHFEPIE